MPRLRRYLPPLIILLPQLFVCGKLLLTPVELQDSTDPRFSSEAGFGRFVFLRGWPWEFEASEEVSTPPNSVKVSYFSGWNLAADIAVLAVALLAGGALLAQHYRRRGRWFSVSLPELFVLLTLAALAAGWWMHHVIRWRNEQALLEQLDRLRAWERSGRIYFGPQWIRRFATDDQLEHFFYPETLDIDFIDIEEGWTFLERSIDKLAHVRILSMREPPARVPDWTPFRNLEELRFERAADGALAGIDRVLRLRTLSLENCDITSESLISIGNCKCLEALKLRSTFVKDDGLKELARLPRLRELDLTNTNVTDAGVAFLNSISSLQTLSLDCTRATGECLTALQKLPLLETLDLAYLVVNDEEARRLLDFPGLKEVWLSEQSQITDETLALLKARIENVYVGAPIYPYPHDYSP